MKNVISLIALHFLLLSSNAFSGGGTVVGNGAGLVEGNFQYAYSTLGKIIENCLSTEFCNKSDDEKKLLIKIKDIVHNNQFKKDRILFVSEKKQPGFFTTGLSEEHRIAKTFLTPNSPIYVNSDLLYSAKGDPLISMSTIVRILVHELGHQTGIENHQELDLLGSIISLFSEAQSQVYRYKIFEEEMTNFISFSVNNYTVPKKSFSIQFNWRNKIVFDITKNVASLLNCDINQSKDLELIGYELTNGHFDVSDSGQITFNSWVNLHCINNIYKFDYSFRKSLVIRFNSEFEISEFDLNSY